MSAAKVDGYFLLAERASKTADILFRADQMEDAALNVQQMVERIARGLLTHSGIPFGTSHNLGQMAEAFPADHPFRDRIRGFDDLSTAVTAYRYPTEGGRLKKAPPADVLRKKLEDAEQLLHDATEYVYGPGSKPTPLQNAVKKPGIP